MKFFSALVALVCAAAAVEATGSHRVSRARRHGNLAHRAAAPNNAGLSRRCAKSHAPASSPIPTTTSVESKATSAVSQATPSPSKATTSSSKAPSTSHKAESSSSKTNSDPSKSASNSHTNESSNGSCSNKAAGDISAAGGPNGSQKYLNCGIDGSGWNPPFVGVSDLVVSDLSAVRNQAFKPCSDEIISLFYKYGDMFGVPPILLASFAMQESSCNPGTIGGGGEQGLMQISRDKCGGRSDSACREPDFNIKTGAKYFSDQLKNNDGNVLATVGGYNGFFRGMTRTDATKAAKGPCCRCQQNLDYLQQFFNGWLQGVSAYDGKITLGTYFNLNVCT